MEPIYTHSNKALDTLGEVWDTFLVLIQAVSEASNNVHRAEPNLVQLQKDRRALDALLATLKSQVEWIQTHDHAENQQVQDNNNNKPKDDDDAAELAPLLQQQAELATESARLSDQIKRLLSQSYSLQFQMDMLMASSHDPPVSR
ncbi:hypothetical protein BX666DRAFT_1884295 [Dichotomocladium elegans]|nr:hypothetical protein BX666DRAFT_1884295 [Dichotomocladium elegans]